ncbi:MAG: DUF6807 family protein [Candidatus Aminicenantales bacterium]
MRSAPFMTVLVMVLGQAALGQFAYVEDPGEGTLTVSEGKTEVLIYRYGDQIKAGIDPRYAQSCYIHPLFSLDGRALTDDFPADHFHHHGLFWAWPVVRARGISTSSWEPKLPRLRQHFVRWLKREAVDEAFALSVENNWRLDEKETVAKEIVTLKIHPADKVGRAIDLQLTIEALGGPLELQGTPDENKGYGGLCFRGAPIFTGATMTMDEGMLKEDAIHTPFRWVDLSAGELGIAVFVSPHHPGYPVKWMVRNSYAGIINVSWPGLASVVLEPGEPITLRYRIYVHRGDVAAGEVNAAYLRYVGKPSSSIPLSFILPHQGGGNKLEIAVGAVFSDVKAAGVAYTKGRS